MAVSRELSRFVRDALAQGRSREEIAEALGASGWSASEVADALGAWAETAFSPPVPRPQTTVSARDFFVYALTFGLMVTGAIYLVQLLHVLIDMALDDDNFASPSRIRWAIAVLVVATPVYLWLTLRERAKLAADPALYRSAIRKWLTYITLLLSAAVLLGDLIAVIYAFLSGDFTLQFLLKALVVAGVAGLIFLFYLNDIRKGDAA
ncbi:DUF5671 domain-containing protein [Marimonas sp. MJW-29]|uniref:DUF5671 domain-containing protein n=1 Tax=Sulfitobacter sediminis TaxID=3234186 RepID=A0ABV3RRB8_9RHOB